jgi:plastocyanin
MKIFIFLTALLIAPLAPLAASGVPQQYTLTIRDHRFIPAELTLPANTKVRLLVVNEDATAEEFESHELNREKLAPSKSSITVYVGPLKAGRYAYFGDFHQDTAMGVVIVR